MLSDYEVKLLRDLAEFDRLAKQAEQERGQVDTYYHDRVRAIKTALASIPDKEQE